ncbi:cobyrinate a,c-diamide synthase [uncultured Desulfovibrio sp.]|uniref:cobyrinate a,c-diamide synthase n=1 Tax=uncultured Desulfovibrio sp. TaxID=167968 RepID=UPI0003A1B691|nr:cobyrinate a,c-diamide synthase [uncultured Desulfovibrio sp.]
MGALSSIAPEFFASLPRLCVSALSGGGGKTLLSLGLARAVSAAGVAVKPFKKGPDYIDAAWLALAAGRPATNLDPFFLPPARLRALFVRAMSTAAGGGRDALGLVEGNRGLFDGLDVEGSCSTAALARVLACPILLSLDCTKMTRTAAALVQGMLNFEAGLQFCGVVLNQVGSARHESVLRHALETYTDLAVLGALPRLAKNPLPERHMGIACHGDALAGDAQRRLDDLAALVRKHIDLAEVLSVARAVPFLAGAEQTGDVEGSAGSGVEVLSGPVDHDPVSVGLPAPRIGYVRDAALWFYYQENLEALSHAGAELVSLSLLDGGASGDAPNPFDPWQNLDGLYLGGGFPEDCAPELSRSPRLPLLARLAESGLPIYAECGGFMLLAQGIEREGMLWPMSNVFPVTARICPRPQGLGYVQGTVRSENPFFPPGMVLRGHEFHYSHCRWEKDAPPCAMDLTRGKGMGRIDGAARDGLMRDRVWAAYTHIFAPAVPCWAPNFVAVARKFHRERDSTA